MTIALAQTQSVPGDISANIDKHKLLIGRAHSAGAHAIFFPELSLSGYEPKLAKELVTSVDDSRLDVFQAISENSQLAIGLGLPTLTLSGILISMIVFQPGRQRQIYSKQLLHADELPWFTEGKEQLILTINGKSIAPAICFESLQAQHAEQACRLGAQIYLASVAKSQNGLEKGMSHYPEIARKYKIPVLMTNCIGWCDDFQSVGGSAVWKSDGTLAGQLDNSNEGLLIYDLNSEEATTVLL